MPRSVRPTISPTPRVPRGFTLVEVVVAAILMAIAALGVASSTTFVARLAASARAMERATRTVTDVVDSLRALPCTTLGNGSASSSAGVVHWRTTIAPGTRAVRAVLTPASLRVPRAVVEEVVVPCE